MNHEKMLNGLRNLCGYVENGSDTVIKIFQDDATRDWIVRIGQDKSVHGTSFEDALKNAINKYGEDYLL